MTENIDKGPLTIQAAIHVNGGSEGSLSRKSQEADQVNSERPLLKAIFTDSQRGANHRPNRSLVLTRELEAEYLLGIGMLV